MNRGDRRRIIVRFSAEVPLWRCALYALILFVASFSLGRYTREFTRESNETNVEQQATTMSLPAVAESSGPKAISAGVTHVTIRGMEFVPSKLEIKAGDTVEWRNDDITPHTVTCASFDSGSIAADESWRHTFTSAEEIAYACTFHPNMKGAVSVR